MASNKKPRKPYAPRAICVPMQKSTRDSIALDLHLAVEALIAAPGVATYNQLSKMMAAIVRTGAAGESLDTANDALTTICDRYERVSKVGVSMQKTMQLRHGSAGIDEMLGRIPVNKFRDAVACVSIYCGEMGI